ncbi:MAG: Gfo/Idh/MocA family oxidoreductase [Phycisphaeraceae bacterium]|nr:Gfo/Idh/MocA family oxidoreductase [Phycisphaeraceae bacterium]
MKHSKSINRRQFLKKTGQVSAAVSLPWIIPRSVLGQGGRTSPNNRITLGCIGLGIQGTGNMQEFLQKHDVQVTDVCDVWRGQRQKAKQIVDSHYDNQDCRMHDDFRQLCARDDIDAVCIATPDHWHPLIGIDAARQGKHMYYEKPIGWSFEAGQVLRQTIQRYGVAFQFGTQQRSSRDFRFACELVRNGKIGKLESVLVGVPGGVSFPHQPVQPVPQDLDYDRWLGPAPRAPYSYERCRPYVSRPDQSWEHNYSMWYHISDYCIGFIGNWGIHHIDIAQWGSGTEATGPVEVQGAGTFPEKGLADNALTWQVENKFANGLMITHMDTATSAVHPKQVPGFSQGVLFRGAEGWVSVNRQEIKAYPESLLRLNMRGEKVRFPASSNHHRNFLDAIKTGSPTLCPIDVAVRSNTICQLDNVAIKLKRKLQWDPDTEQFVNDRVANQLLSRPMRSPWHL